MAKVKRPATAVLPTWRLVTVRGAAGMRRVPLSDDMHNVLEGFARARQDDDERQDSCDAAEPNHRRTVSQQSGRPPARQSLSIDQGRGAIERVPEILERLRRHPALRRRIGIARAI